MEPIPLRMLNEVVYCPRLFALEHVFGDFADNEHTVEGRNVHHRVDQPTTSSLPDPEGGDDRPRSVRRVHLSDETLGMIGIIDLVEADGGQLVPVDYKKGSVPATPARAWDPERVQVCAQGLLLRAHGYDVTHGVLYFAASRQRVEVPFTEELVQQTLAARDQARAIVRSQTLPPPLQDSPKCCGCSLIGICLPDEHYRLTQNDAGSGRSLVPARDDTLPVHITLRGGRAGLKGGEIYVKDRNGDSVASVRLEETSHVVLHGNITVTTPLIHELAQRDIPVAWHSFGGWYQGTLHPASGRNVLLRHQQHLAAADPAQALRHAQQFVHAKIKNQRVLLRRNARGIAPAVLAHMKDAAEQALLACDADTLRGIEGMAARRYFESFSLMVRSDLRETFAMQGRNRRPPRDPLNALLSFAYAMLVREIGQIAHRIGFDPHVGFLHTMRPGRPALALDLIEEFRPIIADSTVLNVLNNGVVQQGDFLITPVGVSLHNAGKRRFIQTLERRLDELVTHPLLGTRWSYRRTLEVQARLLGKVLLGELDAYPGFVVR